MYRVDVRGDAVTKLQELAEPQRSAILQHLNALAVRYSDGVRAAAVGNRLFTDMSRHRLFLEIRDEDRTIELVDIMPRAVAPRL